jgi:tRNA-2-methylthio-N6-dimethylallyladenosine synthase
MDNNMKHKKYFIRTYGCQMNFFDSEVLSGHLENMGYTPAEKKEDADVLILNTCAVRKKAEEKVFSKLGRLRPLKEETPGMIIAVCGCMVQQKEVARKIKERFHFVNLICGTHSLGRFPELLEKARHSSGTIVDIDMESEREYIPVKREDPLKAWVPISQGCNNYCTYCIVPYVRGAEKSRPAENIIQEIKKLAQEGYKEVTLLGQNVNSYGHDLYGSPDFAELLQEVDKIEGLLRIRFMTSHPKDISDKLIRVIEKGDKICEHIHLPLQAGSNKILKLMNRGYTKEYYLDLVKKIKNAIPDYSLTTDIITGFPGEKENDFEETLQMLKKIRFDAAFTFVYSPREGTEAAGMENQMETTTKKRRIMEINELQNQISLERNLELLNQEVEILVEGISKTDPDFYTGRTRTNKIVHFSSPRNMLGELFKIKITGAKSWTLTGELS